MKRPWILAISLSLAGLAGLGLAVGTGALPLDNLPFGLGGRPTPVAIDDLGIDSGYVVVEGTAHYPVRVTQTYTPRMLHPRERIWYIFPVFRTQDVRGREVQVLVLTERVPDSLLDFEDLTVRGRTHHPNGRWLSRGVLDSFRAQGYSFADDFTLLVEYPPRDEAE